MSRLIDQRKRFVTLDARDSSITLSPRLLREMGGEKALGRKILLFTISEKTSYAFAFLPEDVTPAQRDAAPSLRRSADGRSVGFECLITTVAAILFRYDIPDLTAQLYVRRRQIHQLTYYEILNKHH